MLNQLLEFSVLFAFLGFCYAAFIKNRSNYNFQRGYILTSLLVSIFIPLMPSFGENKIDVFSVLLPQINVTVEELGASTLGLIEVSSFTIIDFLYGAYLIGILVMMVKLLYSLYSIREIVRSGKRKELFGIKIIESSKIESACSFLNMILIPEKSNLSDDELEVVLHHERFHIQYGHSIEKIFLETCAVFLWWHPSMWYFKKQLELVHEFQVDHQVTQQVGITKYKEILLQLILHPVGLRMVNPISSQIKKRFTMMDSNNIKPNFGKTSVLLLFIFSGMLLIHACSQDEDDKVQTVKRVKEETPKSYVSETVDTVVTFDYDTKIETVQIVKGERIIFNKPDVMPAFPGCDASLDTEALKDCSNQKMLEFIYSNIKYPQEAKEKGVEGMVVVKFVIDNSGYIGNIEYIRELGFGMEDAVGDMLTKMQEEIVWSPGIESGKKVNVAFTLPVKFKLQ